MRAALAPGHRFLNNYHITPKHRGAPVSNGIETFERGPVLASIGMTLPARTYNLTRILLADSANGCVFVPIRPMQFMAVIDPEEIIFVDSQYKRWVAVAWRAFRPGDRTSLEDPVAYEAAYYNRDGTEIQARLQIEFHKALALLDSRRPTPGKADVLEFGRPSGD
jgi:hypothetical protein